MAETDTPEPQSQMIDVTNTETGMSMLQGDGLLQTPAIGIGQSSRVQTDIQRSSVREQDTPLAGQADLPLKDNNNNYQYYKCQYEGQWKICRLLDKRPSQTQEGTEYLVQFIQMNSRTNDYRHRSEIQMLTEQERQQNNEIILAFKEKDKDVRRIHWLHFGGYVIDVWYDVPLPPEFQKDHVYCCEFCLNFMNNERAYRRHMEKCKVRVPPGNEIYRDDYYIFYELDGMAQKRYLRNYSYLARMFLQHKTLEIDVDVFYFYVLYARPEVDAHNQRVKRGEVSEKDPGPTDTSYHNIGYFSKEKPINLMTHNILSCILTMPCYQGLGYGNVLIDMAYLLAARDNLIGSPEKPLSDLGYMAFSRYWRYRILEYLVEHEANTVTLWDVVRHTNFAAVDVQQTLRTDCLLLPRRSGDFVVYLPEEAVERFFKQAEHFEHLEVHRLQERFLHYVPCAYVQRDASRTQDDIVLHVRKLAGI